eukprot:gb/GFBE01046324.1/.p1 GENE.gb/GFBE01046324.1/~~gb/GFBE01046324.1/.p1  ORF type:complete len:677 (+),score=111.66 gb/GFBE01046324.1/:1-2031(+)
MEKELRRRIRQESARSTVSPILEGEEGEEVDDDDEEDCQEEQTVRLEVETSEEDSVGPQPTLPPTKTVPLPVILRRSGSCMSSLDTKSPKTPGSRGSHGRDGESTPPSSAAINVAPMAALAAAAEYETEGEHRPQGVLTRAFSRLIRASSSLSSLLGGPSRATHRLPTLASVSQRRTLASMVSLSLNSPQLLRATRASDPLRHFGAVLRDRRSTRVGFGRSETSPDASNPAASGRSGSFDDYMMSFQTRFIDHFWSHSWRANTNLKVLVLLLYYNQAPAAIAGALCACVGMVLRATNVLPFFIEQTSVILDVYRYASWSSICGLSAFFVVLFLWRPKERVFLDKVCIHQKDPVLKKEGVESIGAFLYHSRTMLVLWDPSYAERLWCVFEMAAFAWAHRNDLKNRVEIRPVIFAPVFFGLMLTCTINWGLIIYMPKTLTFSVTVWPAVESLICVLGAHFLRRFHRDMNMLRKHLTEFQVANSQCYCCSVGHKLPETDEKIACDREVIQACIVAWFGSLADFDNFVQAELASYFFRSLGHFGVPYRWVIGSQIPVLWAYMDVMAETWAHGQMMDTAAYFVEGLAMWLCASPLVCAFVIWVTNLLQTKRECALVDGMVSSFAAFLALVPLFGLTMLWYVTKYVVCPHPLAGAAVFFIVTAELTTLTFKWGRSNCLSCWG